MQIYQPAGPIVGFGLDVLTILLGEQPLRYQIVLQCTSCVTCWISEQLLLAELFSMAIMIPLLL